MNRERMKGKGMVIRLIWRLVLAAQSLRVGTSSQLNVGRVIRTPDTTWKGREEGMIRMVEWIREREGKGGFKRTRQTVL